MPGYAACAICRRPPRLVEHWGWRGLHKQPLDGVQAKIEATLPGPPSQMLDAALPSSCINLENCHPGQGEDAIYHISMGLRLP